MLHGIWQFQLTLCRPDAARNHKEAQTPLLSVLGQCQADPFTSWESAAGMRRSGGLLVGGSAIMKDRLGVSSVGRGNMPAAWTSTSHGAQSRVGTARVSAPSGPFYSAPASHTHIGCSSVGAVTYQAWHAPTQVAAEAVSSFDIHLTRCRSGLRFRMGSACSGPANARSRWVTRQVTMHRMRVFHHH